MIDLHNHILPKIDDGSLSLEMSLEMLNNASNQGITDVVNTVHYQHPKLLGINISLDKIREEVDVMQSELDNNNIPIKLHYGAEVFFLPNLLDIKDDPLATFLHGKYMLIEFQFHQIPDIQKQQLFDLKMAGVTPIIAHPERYKPVQENSDFITDWLEAGCLIQVDAGSLLGTLGRSSKIISEKIIKNGWCHILGSDSHDNSRRNFCLKDAYELAYGWIGDNADKLIKDNPKAVIEGNPITIEFEYESKKQTNFYSLLKSRIGKI